MSEPPRDDWEPPGFWDTPEGAGVIVAGVYALVILACWWLG